MAIDARAGSKYWTETEARAALAELARSGESELLFAQRRGYSRERLRYWKKRLSDPTKPMASTKPAFVAVTMPVVTPAASKIEIQVGRVIVRVREDLDVGRLVGIVDAISRVPEC